MKTTRQKIGYLLRKMSMIGKADQLLFYFEKRRLGQKNKKYMEDNPSFISPPEHLAFDAYNHVDYELYERTGKSNADFIKSIIQEHYTSAKLDVFEWGCGPARIIKHLSVDPAFEETRLYGSDYNKETISWCKKNYNNVSFFSNELAPPVPFPNNHFDFIYAFSVFTHLSEEMHYAWINEISRILKPQCIFVFTTHGEYYKQDLFEEELNRFDAGQLVVRSKAVEGSKCFGAYHPEKFIENLLSKNFKILKHLKKTDVKQDFWIVKKSE